MIFGLVWALARPSSGAAIAAAAVNSINLEDDTAILLEDGTELLLEA